MLDLTTLCGNLYEIKMADGEVLHLKRPTQGMYQRMIDLGQETNNGENTTAVMEIAMDMFTKIINQNDKGKQFTQEELSKDYNFTIALMVMNDYMTYYANEIGNKVNFQPAQ